MNKRNLKSEIFENIKQIYIRLFWILPLLLIRLLFQRRLRTFDSSYSEYNSNWIRYWKDGDYLNANNKVNIYGVKADPISALNFKKEVSIKIISEIISKFKIKSVLEIGSGIGLNLILLAQEFPNVQFFGLEPTDNGVELANEFIISHPSELQLKDPNVFGKLNNVSIIKGSILDEKIIEDMKSNNYDLVFTNAVLEQLNNYLDVSFANIFKLTKKYFLFYEEFLEANYLIENYQHLVKMDYFRISWDYLNKFKNIKIINRFIPALQQDKINYAIVFGEKSAY